MTTAQDLLRMLDDPSFGKPSQADAARKLLEQLDGGSQPEPKKATPKDWKQAIWENVVGDNDPTTQNAGEKLGSFLNKAGEAMTFGLVGDEASAGVESLMGADYEQRRDHYRMQEENLERDHPIASIGAEIGGGVLGALVPAGAAAKGMGAGARIGRSIGAGMLGGATYGFAEGEGLDDRRDNAKTGALWGGTAGAAAPFIGRGIEKGINKALGNRAISQAARNAPTTEQLRAMGRAAYQEIDDAGVQVKPEAFDASRAKIMAALKGGSGFDDLPGPGSLTPNSARVAQIMGQASDEMAQEPTAALPFKAVDQMRRQAGAAAGNVTNKTDQKAGMMIIEGLDEMIQNLGENDVVAGDATALKKAIPKAREIWSRMSKSQLIDDAIDAGENNYLSGGASGIRNQFARILRNPKLSRGFSDTEIAAMRRVVQGSTPEKILNLLGGGLGQLAQIGAGFGAGGPVGALAGAGMGIAARKGSEAVASRNAELARAIIAGGKAPKNLPQITQSSRDLIDRLVRRTGVAQSH